MRYFEKAVLRALINASSPSVPAACIPMFTNDYLMQMTLKILIEGLAISRISVMT